MKDENHLTHDSLKTVRELMGLNFFVPSYQRGYRWSKMQVEELLDDIDSFANSKKILHDEWYCLQPIIVKKCDNEYISKNNPNNVWYEVIDGQQRLTTLYMIMSYINSAWVGEEKYPKCNIEYQTRADSWSFLCGLEAGTNSDNAEKDNIDFHHMSNAFKNIKRWAKNKDKDVNWDRNSFSSNFLRYCKVIWYEIDHNQPSVKRFTRINSGKIPLSKAELIKALFLKAENFDENINSHKQIERAFEWDRIEMRLQTPDLWHFLSPPTSYVNHIEFLLTVTKNLTDLEGDIFQFYEQKTKIDQSNPKKSQKSIEELWQRVKYVMNIFEEWYDNNYHYHKIGYLLSTAKRPLESLLEIIEQFQNNNKDAFGPMLDGRIQQTLKEHEEPISIDEIDFENDKEICTRVLLLHNIETVNQSNNEYSRFPFSLYRKDKWSIEHIHARCSEQISEIKHFKEWYSSLKDNEAFKRIVSDEIRKRANILINSEQSNNRKKLNEQEIIKLVKCIEEELEKDDSNKSLTGDAINGLGNLALLPHSSNASLSNKLFLIKKSRLIELEQEGKFIPVCTRNAFLKYYTVDSQQYIKWTETDAEAYQRDIATKLAPYLLRDDRSNRE